MIITDLNKHIMLEHLVRARVFSLDTETTGLDWTDRAFAVTVSTREKDFYFEDIRLIKHLFHLPMEVIMINAKFDMRMIELPFYSRGLSGILEYLEEFFQMTRSLLKPIRSTILPRNTLEKKRMTV